MTTFLLVAFAIISVILILMVLVQNDEKNGMGGMMGGGNTQAFGANSGSILKKATAVFVALFFVLVLVLAFTLKGDKKDLADPVDGQAVEQTSEGSAEETPAAETTAADNAATPAAAN